MNLVEWLNSAVVCLLTVHRIGIRLAEFQLSKYLSVQSSAAASPLADNAAPGAELFKMKISGWRLTSSRDVRLVSMMTKVWAMFGFSELRHRRPGRNSVS
jgi:hypothetical protein